MYVVTFYSYKGGVGRTLALMNAAVALARANKRVLLVDFDLEAPGLCSYRDLNCPSVKKGVVEYVGDYLSTNRAPKVGEFISKCELDGQSVWLMPAGDQSDPNYSLRLSSINWEDLYEHRSGFLMFEDLKQQWKSYDRRGFDYVLIDSRTGHTDVGGICTRHLPDAVVILFLPNEQNISGLAPIVDAIRRESVSPRGKSIRLHFCPSNVPFLDDEDGILSRILSQAEERLGYTDAASTIHHYNSLELLDQRLFSLHHAKSLLAREYAQLKNAIAEGNIEDREGVMQALERAVSSGTDAAERIYSLPLEEMQTRHGSDPDVAARLAHAFFLVGDFDQQLAAADIAIAAERQLDMMLMMRALMLLRRERESEAVADIHRLLTLPDLPGATIVLAAELLRQLQPDDWWRPIVKAAKVRALGVQEQKRLVQILMSNRESLEAAVDLMDALLARKDVSTAERDAHETLRILAFIGMRKYRRAITEMGETREQVLTGESLTSAFNYAVAEWGISDKAPKDLFASLLERPEQIVDPNYSQCLAVAAHVVGRRSEAARHLDAARRAIERQGRSFSCWSYLQRDRDGFIADLEEMESAMCGKASGFKLGFMTEEKEAVH